MQCNLAAPHPPANRTTTPLAIVSAVSRTRSARGAAVCQWQPAEGQHRTTHATGISSHGRNSRACARWHLSHGQQRHAPPHCNGTGGHRQECSCLVDIYRSLFYGEKPLKIRQAWRMKCISGVKLPALHFMRFCASTRRKYDDYRLADSESWISCD